jgi:hypothetical protein
MKTYLDPIIKALSKQTEKLDRYISKRDMMYQARGDQYKNSLSGDMFLEDTSKLRDQRRELEVVIEELSDLIWDHNSKNIGQ